MVQTAENTAEVQCIDEIKIQKYIDKTLYVLYNYLVKRFYMFSAIKYSHNESVKYIPKNFERVTNVKPWNLSSLIYMLVRVTRK